MLKLDPGSKTLVSVAAATLTQANILERADLQASIVRSWDAFCSELGYEELFLIGSEVVPHDSCRDRIDILALSRDGTPVIFELKRHRDRLQLLQGISYAAMVAKWDAARFLRELTGRPDEEAEELRGLLAEEGFAFQDPEVVLVAESFDPEVILAADWLSQFGVPISAFAVSTVEYRGDTLISVSQKFPLLGLDDLYVRRGRPTGEKSDTSWDEVVATSQLPFAKKAVEIFLRHAGGSPDKRAFFSIYSGSALGRLRIVFTKQHLKVYTLDQSTEAEEVLRQKLGTSFELGRWGSESTKNAGFSFKIISEAQFLQFLQAVGEKTV